MSINETAWDECTCGDCDWVSVFVLIADWLSIDLLVSDPKATESALEYLWEISEDCMGDAQAMELHIKALKIPGCALARIPNRTDTEL